MHKRIVHIGPTLLGHLCSGYYYYYYSRDPLSDLQHQQFAIKMVRRNLQP
jgi:hypothetical protein